jgi:hypothetical protein
MVKKKKSKISGKSAKVAKRNYVAKKPNTPGPSALVISEEEKKISFLKDKRDSLKDTISDMRKHGKDTKVAELKLIELDQKTKLVSVTSDNRDYDKSFILIQEVEKEIKEINDRPEKKDVSEEVRKIAEEYNSKDKNKAADESSQKSGSIQKASPQSKV